MPKARLQYVCQQCGANSARWMGRCSECGAWNSYVEEVRPASGQRGQARVADLRARSSAPVAQPLAAVSLAEADRISTDIGEFDRVLGGGIVPGSMVLIGGDPGIGKSTLLLQAAASVASAGRPVLYVSGEESARQVRLRAERLGALTPELLVLAETSVDAAISQIEAINPSLVIIDSIQTMFLEGVPSSPGNVTQLRECTLRLMNVAKSRNVAIVLVGHVTKEGNIAGPRALEHIVDCVLYLEGERFYAYRVLRAEKNRFGSTTEVGVFEMGQDGLQQVANPSAAFMSDRVQSSPGSAVTVPMEGSRAILVEVQALVADSGLAMPRRTSVGFDMNRLHLLVAVLSRRVGLHLSTQDVYVNVVAGLKLGEPAVDLAVALAIASSARDVPLDQGMVAVGEVGLLGELRPVGQLERRLSEAERLGFERCILPAADLRRLGQKRASSEAQGMVLTGAETVAEAITLMLGPAESGRRQMRSGRASFPRDADVFVDDEESASEQNPVR